MDSKYLIVFFFILHISEIKGALFKEMNKINLEMEEILFRSEKEESLLQCAQKCRFTDKESAIIFQDGRCECRRYKENGNDMDKGSLSGLFLTHEVKETTKIDGGWGSWMNSTVCTKTCDSGTLVQKRLCDSPSPEYGGNQCNGVNKRTMKCNTQKCPVDGGWSSWLNSTVCTQTCGSGTLQQNRLCDSPSPDYGGADCNGVNKRKVKCNTQKCPIDVALGKKAKQSSTYNSKFIPSKAVDGSTGQYALTKYEDNPWWEVDMGEVKVIKDIRLNAEVWNGYNKGLIVETRKNEEDSWTLCSDIGDQEVAIRSFKCTNEQSAIARFLRIRSTKKCYLSLKQVEIFGH